ncbi:MAG: hypothetical protein M3461_12440 [Pseudomonadota bacterium]|nr:hypothetical protein [Pseudomonadota bacterium]
MEPLRFLHIPKTAGTTLTFVLRRWYEGSPHFHFSGNVGEDLKRYDALPDEVRKQIALFTGHAGIKTGIPAADNIPIITLLREPVARVKSFCQHVSERKSPYLLYLFPPDAFDLDAFLCSDNGELSNLQTKLLLGRSIEGLSASEAVDIALGNLLEKITCFGIQEHFDESLALIAWTLGIKPPAYGSRNQRDPTRALRFDRSHLDKIIELNAIDLELYERARQSFMQRTGLAACRT